MKVSPPEVALYLYKSPYGLAWNTWAGAPTTQFLAGLLIILVGCSIFLSLFLDVMNISMSTFSS